MALLILKALTCRTTSCHPNPETCLVEVMRQGKGTVYRHTMHHGESWPLNRRVFFDTDTTIRLWSQNTFGAGDDDAFLGEARIKARKATDARRAFRIDGAIYELIYDVQPVVHEKKTLAHGKPGRSSHRIGVGGVALAG